MKKGRTETKDPVTRLLVKKHFAERHLVNVKLVR
jgi:hypothetical protein